MTHKPLPDGWRWVRLGEVCDIAGTRDPRRSPDMPFHYVDISSVDNVEKRIVAARTILGSDAPSRARQVIRANDVLAATTRPNLNAVALVPSELDGEICSTGFCVLRAKVELDPQFLFAFVQTQDFVKTLSAQVRGVMYPAVTNSQVRAVKIPLPPLPTQRRLADLLNRADALRRRRAAADRRAADFLPALFTHTFGDPATNPKGWEVVRLGDITVNHDARRVPVKAANRPKQQGAYPYYGASGIVDYVDEFIFDFDALLIAEDGANLLTRVTPIAFIATGKYWVNNHAHVVTCKDNASVIFLEHYLNFIDLRPYITGSAQPKLSRGNMDRIPVPLPPLPLQHRFAAQVEAFRAVQVQQTASRGRLDEMFQSVLHRAFSGEL